jgi:hypothetical protein
MKVDVDNCIISDYDRNLHVEGISSNINYSNSSVRNFFGIALIVSSANTRLTYNNCNASALLPANPLQERLGLGGVMQFNSTVDLYLNNKSVFSLNGPASFRANVHLEDNSILDLGNSDVFFDHTNLFVNTGASIINIPTKVGRGYNMYGGSVEFNGATFTAFNRERDEKAAFNGENISQASIANCKLNNTQFFYRTVWDKEDKLIRLRYSQSYPLRSISAYSLGSRLFSTALAAFSMSYSKRINSTLMLSLSVTVLSGLIVKIT